jgi:hypothetical protein
MDAIGEQDEPVSIDDAHRVARIRARLAARAPQLPAQANLSIGPARRDHERRSTDQRLCPHLDPAALREPDPEERLADLDERGYPDEDEPPRRGDDEHGEDDCDYKKHAGGEIRTHTPLRAEDFKSRRA